MKQALPGHPAIAGLHLHPLASADIRERIGVAWEQINPQWEQGRSETE